MSAKRIEEAANRLRVIKPVRVTPLENIAHTEFQALLTKLYAGETKQRLFASLLNAIITDKLEAFVFSRGIVSALLKNDPKAKDVPVTHGNLMGAIHEFFEEIGITCVQRSVKGPKGKAAIYKVEDPWLLEVIGPNDSRLQLCIDFVNGTKAEEVAETEIAFADERESPTIPLPEVVAETEIAFADERESPTIPLPEVVAEAVDTRKMIAALKSLGLIGVIVGRGSSGSEKCFRLQRENLMLGSAAFSGGKWEYRSSNGYSQIDEAGALKLKEAMNALF